MGKETIHAIQRSGHRGFCRKIKEFLYFHGEWSNARGGRALVYFTRKSLEELLESQELDIQTKNFIKANFDKLAKKALIVCLYTDVIITVLNR